MICYYVFRRKRYTERYTTMKDIILNIYPNAKITHMKYSDRIGIVCATRDDAQAVANNLTYRHNIGTAVQGKTVWVSAYVAR